MMKSSGNSGFTGRKLIDGLDRNTVHIPYSHYKHLLDEALEQNPSSLKNYYYQKAQYEFKDDIPKDTVFVKTKPGLSEEKENEIKYGLLQFVKTMNIMSMSNHSLEKFYAGMRGPQEGYSAFVNLMILILSFFMMIVSFSQKVNDLEFEQGVLLSIGLTKS